MYHSTPLDIHVISLIEIDLHLLPYTTLPALLIEAVYRTRIAHKHRQWPCSEFLRSSVEGHPALCFEGHGFESRRGLTFPFLQACRWWTYLETVHGLSVFQWKITREEQRARRGRKRSTRVWRQGTTLRWSVHVVQSRFFTRVQWSKENKGNKGLWTGYISWFLLTTLLNIRVQQSNV